MAGRCPICGADHAACGGPSTPTTIAITTMEARTMAELKRIQMKDGSTLQLNAEDERRYRDLGLVGEPTGTGAALPPGPADPGVFYDDGKIAEADAKAVEAAPENKAITSKTVKGKE